MTELTLTVPDELLKRFQNNAELTGKTVETVIIEWLNLYSDETSIGLLSDEEVLALADMMLSDEQQVELDDLLEKNSEGQLDAFAKQRLDEMMEIHNQMLLRKAEALAIAVERGLRAPLSSN